MLAAAASEIRVNPLRSFFTLLGIVVSVTFLVAVVAIIQGMNAYVSETIAGAVVGANSFQVRRTPIIIVRVDDEMIKRFNRRPRISDADASAVRAALPDAVAIGVSGGGGITRNAVWNGQTLGGVSISGVTPPYQVVQDYRIEQGDPLTDVDIDQRRAVAVIGHDVADKLFGQVSPLGKEIRLGDDLVTVIGVAAPKGKFLGRSADLFALIPLSRYEMTYGRRASAVVGREDGERRRCRSGDGARRGSDAVGASASAVAGGQFCRRDRGGARRVLEEAHGGAVQRHSRIRRDRRCRRRDRHHEHHADGRHGTDARDRNSESGRRHPT